MNTSDLNSEDLRLAALKEFDILNTLPESEFDDITLLASQICETPIAAVSLMDAERQWFKPCTGWSFTEMPREWAFYDDAIKDDSFFIVPDASEDARFSANPLVIGEPHLRFYAGAPLSHL